jgi:hypothetical protein
MQPPCFACEPEPSPSGERRTLCAEHKSRCVLEDGTLLQSALEAARPAGHPLEGSLLNLVYCPVFVRTVNDHPARGLCDFAAGGMAVYECRHDAETPFEIWISSREEWTPLLSMMRRAPKWVSTVEAFAFPQSALWMVEEAAQWWYLGDRIVARKAQLGRWPASFEELSTLLQPAAPVPLGAKVKLAAEDEARFVQALRECAVRARSS